MRSVQERKLEGQERLRALQEGLWACTEHLSHTDIQPLYSYTQLCIKEQPPGQTKALVHQDSLPCVSGGVLLKDRGLRHRICMYNCRDKQ